ncbi:hypothetical protein D9X30_5057 [Cupriavidus sp. U2]|nr:hypothetical protein D9X30_5057 [Cupriavidus sp. U2]
MQAIKLQTGRARQDSGRRGGATGPAHGEWDPGITPASPETSTNPKKFPAALPA